MGVVRGSISIITMESAAAEQRQYTLCFGSVIAFRAVKLLPRHLNLFPQAAAPKRLCGIACCGCFGTPFSIYTNLPQLCYALPVTVGRPVARKQHGWLLLPACTGKHACAQRDQLHSHRFHLVAAFRMH